MFVRSVHSAARWVLTLRVLVGPGASESDVRAVVRQLERLAAAAPLPASRLVRFHCGSHPAHDGTVRPLVRAYADWSSPLETAREELRLVLLSIKGARRAGSRLPPDDPARWFYYESSDPARLPYHSQHLPVVIESEPA